MQTEIVRSLVLVAMMGINSVLDTVTAHRDTLTDYEKSQTVYLSLLPWEGDQQDDLATALRFMIASASRQQVIEYCTPQRVGEAPVMWIRLDHLKWRATTFVDLLKRYPYDESIRERHTLTSEERLATPNIVRGDWLLVELVDAVESPAYPALLLDQQGTNSESENSEGNAERIETLAALLAFFDVVTNTVEDVGVIAEESKIAKSGVRLLESKPRGRGWCAVSYDSREMNLNSDPLENLDRQFDYDGNEILIWYPKISRTTGARGVAMFGFLADGQGNLVNRAPVDLVADYLQFRGQNEIRHPGACLNCHENAIHRPTKIGYRDYVASGGIADVPIDDVDEVEAYHAADLTREWDRIDEDYERFIAAACLGTPADTIAAFRRAVDAYDAPLNLTTTGIELGVQVASWREALITRGRLNAESTGPGSRRLQGLAYGRTIGRKAWAQQYPEATLIAATLPAYVGSAESAAEPDIETELESDANQDDDSGSDTSD